MDENKDKKQNDDQELPPDDEMNKAGDDLNVKEDDLAKARDNFKQAEATHRSQVFGKYGYEIMSDLRYNPTGKKGDSIILTPKMRNKLGKLDKKEIEKLLTKGIIKK